MLMPKRDRTAIYETLFNDGVLTAMKDFNAPRHPDVEGVKNLYVIKACQSLVSKGYATEQFSWRHYYWYLNNDGVNYLREYLHLPSDVVPATIKKRAPPVPMNRFPQSTGLRDNRPRNDRESYRRYIGAEKKEGPGPDFRPTFMGRGRGSARNYPAQSNIDSNF